MNSGFGTTGRAARLLQSPRMPDGVCLLLLLLTPVIASWPITTGWLTIDPMPVSGVVLTSGAIQDGLTSLDPNVGITTEALGHLAASAWLHGRMPWWNPYDGIGMPLAAEGQNPALFLPFVLLLAFQNGVFLIKLALQEIAGISTFLLLRRLRLSPAAACMGAALFSVNGTFAWFGHGPAMPVAFLPLLLLGIENARHRALAGRAARRWTGWPLAAVALALALYAGFPETTYLDLILVFLWAVLRLAECEPAARTRLFRDLVLAALTGLLLAVPFILPFLSLLRIGAVGAHAGGAYLHARTPLAGLALLVMPSLFGPLGAVTPGTAGLAVSWLWTYMGGYVTLPVLCLALMALLAGRPSHRPLRWMLIVWCVVLIGTSFGLPALSRIVYAIPLLGQTQIFRYAAPSWEFAFAVLAALALEDAMRAVSLSARARFAAAALVVLLTAIALLVARPVVLYLRHGFLGYAPWLDSAVAGTLGVTVLSLLLLYGLPWRTGRRLAAGLIAAQAILVFSVPMLSGTRHETSVTGGVAFLKRHLGLDRFYTLGPIRPNYPAYFQVAAINSDYLPAPRLWAGYLARALDPTADPLSFSGQSQLPGAAVPDHAAELRRNIDAYRNLGVRYVVSVPGTEPLDDVLLNKVIVPVVGLQPLRPGESFDATVTPAELRAGELRAVTVVVATFGGRSHGALGVTACAADLCRSGMADLGMAADNLPFEIRLGSPLPIAPGAHLHLRFTKSGPTFTAIWLYRQAASAAVVPGLGLIYASGGVPHRRVYADAVMAIDEIDGTAPYVESPDGHCNLKALGRDLVAAQCKGSGTLMRRVLFYPGWRARVNGIPAPVELYPPIFQAIRLPAGASLVRFDYAPPFDHAILAAFVAGVLLLLWGCAGQGLGWRPGRDRPTNP
jgi:hypothetical protein